MPTGKAVGDAADVVVWSTSDDLNRFVIDEGRAPATAGEVLVDTAALEDGGLTVGDTVRLLPDATEGYLVVGSIASPGGNEIDGRTTLGLTFEGAAAAFGSDEIETILVAGDGTGTDLVAGLDAALSGDVEAVTGEVLADEYKEKINTFVSIIEIFLTSFAGVAVFVSIFVIYNTFSITVSQRKKEMAMLRAIGATSKQVLRSVLVESLAIGVIASLIGVIMGILLGWVLLQVLALFGFSLGASTLTISTSSLVIGFVVGLVVTVIAAYLPARRAGSVPPMEALRDTAIETVSASKTRTRVGAAMLILGAPLAALGAGQLDYVTGGFGIVLLFGGIVGRSPSNRTRPRSLSRHPDPERARRCW